MNYKLDHMLKTSLALVLFLLLISHDMLAEESYLSFPQEYDDVESYVEQHDCKFTRKSDAETSKYPLAREGKYFVDESISTGELVVTLKKKNSEL